MFTVILKQVWRDSKWMLLFLAACGWVILDGAARYGRGAWLPGKIITEAQYWGMMIPVLAFFSALLLAIITWWPDRRGWWVYALTLPVARERYAALRAAAGGVLLAGLAIVFAAEAEVMAARAVLPSGLVTYAGPVALRFGLALLVCHAMWTMLSLAGRVAARVIGASIAVMVLLELLGVHAFVHVLNALVSPWSPLRILGGRWMFIDV